MATRNHPTADRSSAATESSPPAPDDADLEHPTRARSENGSFDDPSSSKADQPPTTPTETSSHEPSSAPEATQTRSSSFKDSLMKRIALILLGCAVVAAFTLRPAEAEPNSLTIGSKAPALDIEHWIQDGNGKF